MVSENRKRTKKLQQRLLSKILSIEENTRLYLYPRDEALSSRLNKIDKIQSELLTRYNHYIIQHFCYLPMKTESNLVGGIK